MKIALIKAGKVDNVILADEEFAATLTGYDHIKTLDEDQAVGPGYLYDETTDTFSEPPAPEPTPAPTPETKITKLAFRNRFTLTEKATIELAAIDNPAGTMQQRMMAASLRANFADQRDATFIDLSREDLRGGVEVLEHFGLIASGRAIEILDAPIRDEERCRD